MGFKRLNHLKPEAGSLYPHNTKVYFEWRFTSTSSYYCKTCNPWPSHCTEKDRVLQL